MDKWKFFDITHREHVLCNPISVERLGHLIELLRLPPDGQVIDIACGKGEFITRIVERYGISGIGVDLSPYCVADAREKLAERDPEGRIRIIEQNGADFSPVSPHCFDLASCLGASWIYGGHRGTLEALIAMTSPGGWVIAGEPYWRREPSPEYLLAIGVMQDDFGTHVGNVAAGEDMGLHLAYTLVSSEAEWDEYEGLQWYAAETHARTHPHDPDATEIMKRVEDEKAVYLRWGRETLGWAIYAFRKEEERVGCMA